MKALIVVDIQKDFLPGGALAVRDGDKIIPLVNKLIPLFDLVVATQDWHPSQHQSFASNHPGASIGDIVDLHGLPQVLWPDHCIQNTPGAELDSRLKYASFQAMFRKGTDLRIDSYSGFFDNGHRKDTGMGDYLKSKDVQQVFVVGLATDYCVKFTAFDAVTLGFDTSVIRDATRAVNLKPQDGSQALTAMREKGVKILESHELSSNY